MKIENCPTHDRILQALVIKDTKCTGIFIRHLPYSFVAERFRESRAVTSVHFPDSAIGGETKRRRTGEDGDLFER